MKKPELIDCFTNLNKRRILNLLRYYPLSLTDCAEVLNLKKSLVWNCLNEFVSVGIIPRKKVSHKLVIFGNLRSEISGYPGIELKNVKIKFSIIQRIDNIFKLLEINHPQFKKDLNHHARLLLTGKLKAYPYIQKETWLRFKQFTTPRNMQLLKKYAEARSKKNPGKFN